MKVRITCTGTRPLLVHNVRLASPLDPYAKQIKKLSSKQKKTDDDRTEMARIEFEGSLYFDDEIGPYLPVANLFASLIGGGRLTKAGKKIERGVKLNDFMLPLIYPGPRKVSALWDDANFVDIRPVVIGRQKVDRCRPIFREWTVESEADIDPRVIDPEEFVSVAQAAGQFEGLGDYRRMYGRYDAAVEEL